MPGNYSLTQTHINNYLRSINWEYIFVDPETWEQSFTESVFLESNFLVFTHEIPLVPCWLRMDLRPAPFWTQILTVSHHLVAKYFEQKVLWHPTITPETYTLIKRYFKLFILQHKPRSLIELISKIEEIFGRHIDILKTIGSSKIVGYAIDQNLFPDDSTANVTAREIFEEFVVNYP